MDGDVPSASATLAISNSLRLPDIDMWVVFRYMGLISGLISYIRGHILCTVSYSISDWIWGIYTNLQGLTVLASSKYRLQQEKTKAKIAKNSACFYWPSIFIIYVLIRNSEHRHLEHKLHLISPGKQGDPLFQQVEYGVNYHTCVAASNHKRDLQLSRGSNGSCFMVLSPRGVPDFLYTVGRFLTHSWTHMDAWNMQFCHMAHAGKSSAQANVSVAAVIACGAVKLSEFH